MIGIVFAMEEEAKQFLESYRVEKVNIHGRNFYVEQEAKGREKILVVISGIGKVNAQISTSILITLGCSRIVNIGTCACTSDRFKVGELVRPNVFYDGDFDLTMIGKITKDPAFVNSKIIDNQIPCYSYSTFITDKRAEDGIIDMEAYGVVAQADAFEVPVDVIKVVSDGGDADEFDSNVGSVITPHIPVIREFIGGLK